jgi:hypothetical protein
MILPARAGAVPRSMDDLSGFLYRFCCGRWCLLGLLLCRKLLPYLGSDGVGVYFVDDGGFFENGGRVAVYHFVSWDCSSVTN